MEHVEQLRKINFLKMEFSWLGNVRAYQLHTSSADGFQIFPSCGGISPPSPLPRAFWSSFHTSITTILLDLKIKPSVSI